MASEGPNSASTIADNSAVGTVAWASPGNAAASDDSRATALLAVGEQSHYLDFSGFGFSIPEDPDGIEVSLERSRAGTGNQITDAVLQLKIGGTVTGDDKADTVTNWPTSDAAVTYGGPSDLWGLVPTAAQINASDFGFVVSVSGPTGGSPDETARVDHGTITVTYPGVIVSLSPLQSKITILGPAVKKGVNVALSPLKAQVSIPALSAAVGSGITVQLPALKAEASLPTATVSSGKTIRIQVGALSAAAALPLVSAAVGSDAFLPVLRAEADLFAVSASKGVTVKLPALQARATLPGASLSKGITPALAPLLVTASVPAIGVNAPLLEQICLDEATTTLTGSTLTSTALAGSTIANPQLVPC